MHPCRAFDQVEGLFDVDSPTMELVKETLVAAEEVIKFVASIAVPPPGGLIISATIAITITVIKGEAVNGNTMQGPKAYCTQHT